MTQVAETPPPNRLFEAEKDSRLRVGMAQMAVVAGQPAANLARARSRIRDAAERGCEIVVLPECLDIGWGDRRARELAQSIPGLHAQELSECARENHIIVVAGLVERAADDRLHNSAVLIDADGRTLLTHRKLNELHEITSGLYTRGEQLSVVQTRIGCVGVAICADNAPESRDIGHVLARMGAQIVLSPCAWAVPPDHDNQATPYGSLWRRAYRELARTHGIPIVGVSSVGVLEDGPWRGWPVIGASLAVHGDGSVAAQGRYGRDADDLIVAEVVLGSSSPNPSRHMPGENLHA